MRGAALAALMLGPAPAFGAETASAVMSQDDPRHQRRAYDAGAVYELIIHEGHAVMILFGEGERIETIGAGESASWRVSATTDRRSLLIKAVAKDPSSTNLLLLTTRGPYAFTLASAPMTEGAIPLFTLRFEEETPKPAKAPKPAPAAPVAAAKRIKSAPPPAAVCTAPAVLPKAKPAAPRKAPEPQEEPEPPPPGEFWLAEPTSASSPFLAARKRP